MVGQVSLPVVSVKDARPTRRLRSFIPTLDIIGNSGLFSLDSSLRWNDRPGQYHSSVFIGCHSSEGWDPVPA
jgi:hypothetical protein